MTEKHFLLTVICLVYFGLSVGTCLIHQGHPSKCQSCSKGRDKKISYYQSIQSNHKTPQDGMGSTKIHFPSANALPSSKVPISSPSTHSPSEIYYPIEETIGVPINIYPEPYEYLRNVRSMETNALDSKVRDDFTESIPHDLNLRDDVIKRRVRRNNNNNIVSSTTPQSVDSDMTPSWLDLINFFQSEKSSDVLKERGEDKQFTQRVHHLKDLHAAISASDESSRDGSSAEFFDRIRQRTPHLFQRLKALQRLIADSSSAEDATYTDYSNPSDADTYVDFDHHSDVVESIDQPKKPNEEKTDANVLISTAPSTEELTKKSRKNDNMETSPTVTNLAAQNHEITAQHS